VHILVKLPSLNPHFSTKKQSWFLYILLNIKHILLNIKHNLWEPNFPLGGFPCINCVFLGIRENGCWLKGRAPGILCPALFDGMKGTGEGL
jgi:hypothetical protein